MDSRSGKLQVTNERICRTESLLDELITKVSQGNVIFTVRKIACIVGQLISISTVIGHLKRWRTRPLNDCVQTRTSWETHLMFS